MRVQALTLSQIRRDGGTQPRASMDDGLAFEYFEGLRRGEKFPPVTVFYDGTDYWLADGFHRCQAVEIQAVDGRETLGDGDLERLERAEIHAEILQGTREDAQWYSFGANKHHGARRSNADKQAAIKAALMHPKSAGLSDNQIAKHVGVAQSTVTEWRKKLETTDASYRIDKIDTRTATRNGTTYQIDTSNIGRRVAMEAPKPQAEPSIAARPGVTVRVRAEEIPAAPEPELHLAAMRAVNACRQLLNCGIAPPDLASHLANDNDAFSLMEEASEFISEVLVCDGRS